MADFTLTWTPGASATSQNVRYRQKGAVDWIDSVNIDGANPQLAAETTADVLGLNVNTVYEFQIQTIQSGKNPAYSAVRQKIEYDCPADTKEARSGSVTIHFGKTFPTIDKMYFQLRVAATEEVIDEKVCTGAVASVTFTSVPAGTYFITFYMEATIDGVAYTSIDQTGDYCSTTNVVVTTP